jgi:hypothetical protein
VSADIISLPPKVIKRSYGKIRTEIKYVPHVKKYTYMVEMPMDPYRQAGEADTEAAAQSKVDALVKSLRR